MQASVAIVDLTALFATPRYELTVTLGFIGHRTVPDGRPHISICRGAPLTRRPAPGDPKPPPVLAQAPARKFHDERAEQLARQVVRLTMR